MHDKRKSTERTYLRSKAEGGQKKKEAPAFAQSLSFSLKYFPRLQSDLAMAGMDEHTPLTFAYFAFTSAVFLSIALLVIIYLFASAGPGILALLALSAPFLLILSFLYFMQYPRIKSQIRARLIDSELLFAGRHILIALRAGIPLYDAMSAAATGYGEASREFNRIIEKITLGTPASVAMHESANANPSQMFRRVVLQLSNSMASGSDVANSLESVLEQISREQVVMLKEYGQKLNPLVMFFMIFGIVFPSLGVALGAILVSFVGAGAQGAGGYILFGLFILIGLLQFIFLSAVDSSRPRLDVG